MHTTYLGLGSNVGDTKQNLSKAIELLNQFGKITKQSSLYKTEPVGFANQDWFLNQVIEFQTELTPEALILKTQKAELQLGKNTPFKNGPRTIDIDILLFENKIIEEENLTVPHPRMHERRFVLEPLAEIAPEATHPVLHKCIHELVLELDDSSEIKKL